MGNYSPVEYVKHCNVEVITLFMDVRDSWESSVSTDIYLETKSSCYPLPLVEKCTMIHKTDIFFFTFCSCTAHACMCVLIFLRDE